MDEKREPCKVVESSSLGFPRDPCDEIRHQM